MLIERSKGSRKSQGAFEYILLLGGILLIVVVAIIILRGSVLNQANQQIGGNTDVYKFQNCIPQHILNPGSVIAHWGFDESSGTSAKEDKGRGGTLYNFNFDSTDGWVSGHSGNALKFDGTNDYVEGINLPISDLSANQLTIAVWVKTSSSASDQMITTKAGPFVLSINAGTGNFRPSIRIGPSGASNWFIPVGTSNVANGQWMHVAVVYDGSAVKSYVNGKQEAISAATGNLDNAGLGGCMVMGRYNFGICNNAGGGQFNGVLDDLVIYNRALSASEIC